jgi:RNA polymerase sigma-70 factor (ECF subfamily)
MVRAYFNLRALKQADSFYAWLLGIANRVVMESHRNNQRHVNWIDIEEVAEQTEAGDGNSYRLDQALSQAIGELPSVYQQVILLRFYGDQSCAEISRNLNVSLGTVTSRLSRAYSMLRNALRKSTENEQNLEAEL